MKNMRLLLITLFIHVPLLLFATKQYCDEPLSAGGKSITLSCEMVGGKYQMILKASGSDYFSVPAYWYVGGVNWSSYVTSGSGTATLVLTLNSNPNLGSNGVSWYMNGNTSSSYTVYGWAMPSGGPTWDGTCAPADATPPSISSVSAENIANKTADIRVQATDAVGITRVVIKNGATTLRDESITSTTSLNQSYTIIALTKNTTYTLTAYCYDAAGNSSSRNVTFTTANNASKTVYFVNSGTASGWAQPYIHYWGSGSGETSFPGNRMDNTGWTNCDNTKIWTADVEGTNGNCIFNQGNSTNQTATRTVSENQFYNYEVNGGAGAWFDIASGIYMMGDMTNWTDDKASDKAFSTWSGGSPTYVTWSKKLAASTTYEFKILHKKNDSWTWGGNSGTITSSTSFTSPNRWWEMDNTSQNCKITTSIAGRYTFYYDFTANRLKVVYPTPPIGCAGTSTTCTSGGANYVSYTITYAGGDIIFSVKSTNDSHPLQSCKISYSNNTSGSNYGTQSASTNVAMTLTNGEATYTLPATGNYSSGNLYFYFTFKTDLMGSEGGTASGFSSGSFTYPIGNCQLEDEAPYMVSAAEDGKTSNSVTLDVEGIVYVDGIENAVTDYKVTYSGGTEILTAVGGKITITGLTANTEYVFVVKALYGGEESSNAKSAVVTTLRESECEGTRGHFAYDAVTKAANPQIDYEIRYDEDEEEMTVIVTSHEGGVLDYVEINWNIPTLASGIVSNANEVTITDGVATWTKSINPAWKNHPMGLLFLYSTTAMDGNLQTAGGNDLGYSDVVYYVVGECSYVEETNPPTMVSASAKTTTYNSVTLRVRATDDTTDPVVKFIVDIDGVQKQYKSESAEGVNQLITIPMSACTSKTLKVYAKDNAGNVSTNFVSVSVTTPGNAGNLALNRPVYISYDEYNSAFEAVDANQHTRWGSTGPDKPRGDDWFVVDLGGIYKINTIKVMWETGTAINYQFQGSYDAVFSPVTYDNGTKNGNLVSGGSFATFDHKTSQPASARNPKNDKGNISEAGKTYDTYDYSTEQVYARYVRMLGKRQAGYSASFWEFEVYGECAEIGEKPVMEWAEVYSINSNEALVFASAIDDVTSPDQMSYRLEVTGGEDGYYKNTAIYNFTSEQFFGGVQGNLMIGGLLPGVPYEIKIYAVDEDGNMSDNFKIVNLTTRTSSGCVFERWDPYAYLLDVDGGSNQIFQKGYRITVVTNDDNTFEVTAYTADEFAELDPPIIQYFHGGNPPLGPVERTMTKVDDEFNTYTYTITSTTRASNLDQVLISPFSGTIVFLVKFPFRDGSICLTDPIEYNIDDGCKPFFVIYQHDDQPTAASLVQYAGGTIDEKILYYRRFAPGIWEPFTVPFSVDSVRVYDTDDHRWYRLRAQHMDGGVKRSGDYWLKEQVANVRGDDFEHTWYDGNNAEPQPGTPYNMAVPKAGNYYSGKYLVFHGRKNQTIDDEFELAEGENPEAAPDNRYTLYANNTMLPQPHMYAYKETDDGEYYQREEYWTLYPFECYVLANEVTMMHMPRPGPWRAPSVTTDIEALEQTDRQPIEIFNMLGQYIMTIADYDSVTLSKILSDKLQSGCYIFRTSQQVRKIMIP